MVTLNLTSALVKYANETTSDMTTQVSFRLANPGTKDIYVKYIISTQGTYTWTFDDGTTEKIETLSAGAVLDKVFTLKPGSLPAGTKKDSITIKVEYYKDDQYLSKIGEDTLSITMYIYIQQSDGTWGNSADNLDESTVVYDDFREFSFVDTKTVKGKFEVVKVANERDIKSEQGSLYSSLLNLQGGGSYTSVKARFLTVSNGTPVKGKIISVATQKEGGSAYWWLQEDTPEQTQYKSNDISTTLKKYVVPLPEDWFAYLELFIKNAGLKLDGLVLFNKF